MPYTKELEAIKKAGQLRVRQDFSHLFDLGSNDYLGLAQDKEVLAQTIDFIRSYHTHGSKASQVVNGYSEIFIKTQEFFRTHYNFADALIFGSGFLANLALLGELPRRKDVIFVDEQYHASGIMATKLTKARVEFFPHNDMHFLRKKLCTTKAKRIFIAVEGVYSMQGDTLDPQVFSIADEFQAFLIVDEAHSAGVMGKNLSGIFEHFNITPQENHIKLSTFGKAYGSYGACVFASSNIINFLQTRAKSLIYTTAPSVFDIAYAYNSVQKIVKNKDEFYANISHAQSLAKEILGVHTPSLIAILPTKNIETLEKIHNCIKKNKIFVGAIRPPTLMKPSFRIILRNNSLKNCLQKVIFCYNT